MSGALADMLGLGGPGGPEEGPTSGTSGGQPDRPQMGAVLGNEQEPRLADPTQGATAGGLAVRSSVLPPSITAAEGCAETDENLKTLFAKAPLVSFHDWNHYRRPTRAKGVLIKGVRTLESRLHQRVMVLMYGPQWREVLKARLDDDEDQDAEESVEDEQQAESLSLIHI